MAVLVFGRSGQVATELGRFAQVRALGRDAADLCSPALCAAIIERSDAQAVINAAAYTAVDRAEEEEALATVINGEAPGAMARAAACRGIPFIHISTDYIFDGAGEAPFTVDDPTAPLNAYGRSKLAGEQAVRAAGGAYAIIRTSWVVSAHGSNFVKTMLRVGQDRDRLNIVADQVGGPTCAADIATACLVIADHLIEEPGKAGTYHFSGAPDVSWADFARSIFEQSAMDVEIVDIPSSDYPTPATRPLNSRLDNSLTQSVFGLSRPDWRKGLHTILMELG